MTSSSVIPQQPVPDVPKISPWFYFAIWVMHLQMEGGQGLRLCFTPLWISTMARTAEYTAKHINVDLSQNYIKIQRERLKI